MKIELNPAKWFTKSSVEEMSPEAKAAIAVRADASATVVSVASSSAKAVENVMTTVAVVPEVKQESGFKRFIDEIGSFFVKTAPGIEKVAIAAEPFLALTPYGPEYDLVVNAIYGAQTTATASLAAGAGLTGQQKMALVLEAVTPGLSAILASKNVTSGVPAAISQFAQNVYNLQTGPVTTVAPVAGVTKTA